MSDGLSWKGIKKAFSDWLLVGFFTMLSTFIIIIGLLLKNDTIIDWHVIYEKGDFFLYSIAFFSSSYVYFRQQKDNDFLKSFTLISMVICSVTYALVSTTGVSTTKYMKLGSFIFIIVSSIIFLITQYRVYKELPDLNQISKEAQKELLNQINFK